MLVANPPAGPAATPSGAADPAGSEEADEPSPGDLLALLDGHWFGARMPTPAANAAAAPAIAQAGGGPPGLPAGAAAALAIALAPAAPGGPADAAPPSAGAPTGSVAGTAAGAAGFPAVTAAADPGTATAAGGFVAALAVATAEAPAARETGAAAEAGIAIELPDTGLSGPAPLAATRSSPGPAPLPLPLPMPADPATGFDDGFGTRIAWMAEQRVGHAEIRLNPEHVGPIDVRVQLDGDQVRAEFHSAHAEVRQAIEASLPRLRELLGQHGLQLGQADVGQRQAGQEGGASRSGTAARAGGDALSGDDAPAPAQAHVRLRGLLDEYA
ncbi:flagellar hook-length control protein FliK [Luteimonas viscosa]|uniref:Flagellar hook-length control protein FliK n=2 Tax=Luteimonas viscosa TaxID=1132694 RepID=A0A5D4XU86_9GAMM|nr:flagellar hook-length control protein FliK [Luteimonas viscosa]